MFKWLKSIEYKVVEVDKAIGRVPQMTPELRESILSLSYHPGFNYLRQKFEAEKATLEKYLREGFTLGESQLHHLQAGVHYLSYLDAEVKRLLALPTKVAQDATADEAAEFAKVRAALDLVGA